MRFPPLTLAFSLLLALPGFAADPLAAQRMEAAGLLVFGRVTPAASAADAAAATGTFADALTWQRQRLQEDRAQLTEVSRRAVADALGSEATPDAAAQGDYVTQVQTHLRRLEGSADEYRQVIERAYRTTLNRVPYAEEFEYWATRPVTTFALMAACIDNWARRNQPGLMVTEGIPSVAVSSEWLEVVRVSPVLAVEIAPVLARPDGEPRAVAIAAGRTVLAPGADGVSSIAGVPFVAAGKRGR